MSVVYIFPNCLEVPDVELLSKRDRELTRTFQIGAYSFLGGYAFLSLANIMMKGRLPFFRTFMTHSILAGTGTYCSAMATEKVCAELWYNKLLIQLADKYNFTPEEVMDL